MQRALLGLALTALAAAGVVLNLGASAIAHPQDHWTGTWVYTGDGGQTYGTLHLTLHHDHVTLGGPYTSSGASGTMSGELDYAYGPVWCGKFRDTSGNNQNKGRFCATLKSDTVSFHGWYNTCYHLPASLCGNRYRWSGEKQ
jgi:hypothetical protein